MRPIKNNNEPMSTNMILPTENENNNEQICYVSSKYNSIQIMIPTLFCGGKIYNN